MLHDVQPTLFFVTVDDCFGFRQLKHLAINIVLSKTHNVGMFTFTV